MNIQPTISIKKLEAVTGDSILTLYVPLQRGPLGHKQNSSQLHAIRSDLKKQLLPADHKLLSDEFEKTIATLGYVNSHKGLLVVMKGSEISQYQLSFTPELEVSIGKSVSLQQLKINKELNKHFYVLAITKKGSKLYSGDMESLKTVPVKGLEQSIEEALRLDELHADSLQNHPSSMGGSGGNGFHGQGGLKDVKKTLYEAYLRTIDKKIMQSISDKTTPLVVVAVGYGQSMFEKVSKYPSIVAGGVTASPEKLSPAQLHAKAVPLFG